ncbi:hypothetical protein AYL99_08679 [Fonsecaea erecta]|uniref:NACHT-NTPase and P-loop NTPases N-terminal domain-containing protein n=1 Tax=Fonsecaea erecta TaxID=1367422 RepID=A0A178ZEM3_9EURO|nr:hypothetical protein AYL99_08679 [Fonsecaea erecta]OAP57941.1 hypothetical protein AYL99_08679 [Fonsecaea erecta]
MSGAAASLDIGLISAVISIIETTKKVYDAAQDAKGQPEVFGKVAAKLPLVLKILQKSKLEAGKGDEDRQDEVEITMEACRAKAEKIQKIFFKAARKDEDEVQVKALTDAIKEMDEMQPSIVGDTAGAINQSNRDGGHNFA